MGRVRWTSNPLYALVYNNRLIFFVVVLFLTTNCQVWLQVKDNMFTATRAALIGNVKSFILIIRDLY